jgi:hypothetical protein
MERAPNPIFFRSTLFKVEPGEEEEINPGRYGRRLAQWLREKFVDLGYPEAEIIEEDWGRCIMLRRQPFMVWIGAGNLDEDAEADYDPHLNPERITWHCFVTGEIPIWNRLFRKVDPQVVRDVEAKLRNLLESNAQITMVAEDDL